MKKTIDSSCFSTAYWRFQETLDLQKRFNVFFGASDSSKSYSAHQHIVFDLLDAKHSDILVVRKQASTIEESCYKLLKDIIGGFGLTHKFDFFYSSNKRQIVYKKTGRKIFFTGCDDADKLKSIYNFSKVYFEEADAMELRDFREFNRRLRGQDRRYMVFILNPTSETHWIKTDLIDGEAFKEAVAVCKVTYHQNEFIDQERIDELERYKLYSEYDYQVYVLGDWGVIRPDSPYFHKIDPNKHFGTCTYDPRQPVYISFDFNITNSALVMQKDGGGLRFLDEIHEKGMDLEDVCKELAFRYGRNILFFTGDASGNAGSAYTTGNQSAWELIQGYMSKHGAAFTDYRGVPRSNPSTASSCFICNALIQHHGKNLIIDRRCKTLVSDVLRMKRSSDGSLDKHDADKGNYGHVGDTFRYALVNFEYDTFKKLGLPSKA